ncbi:MAG: preprotein translocase subunit SecY [Clostridiales bacterium]|jgi:preprotein translocase subunit SecY|nr:preprotein translocase subunit SecY [Clostridiales bacterium]
MFGVFANAWRVADIRKRMMYALLIVVIYRLACHVPLPFMDVTALREYTSGAGNGTFYAMMLGGSAGTIAAMGIGPYINSSIIMQLLTVALPPLERMQKDGERQKLNQITRVVAVALSAIQGGGLVYTYAVHSLFKYHNMLVYVTAAATMVTGTIFIMWLSELLTEKAIANGSSFIIFSNILAGVPAGAVYLWSTVNFSDWTTVAKAVFVIIVFVAIITFVILVQEGERKIPVQYSKKMQGQKMFGATTSFIPIKVNIAGVMSIIFAVSLLQLPQFIHGFLPENEFLGKAVSFLNIHNLSGAVIYVILIFAFTFFYSSFALNPVEISENMKKSGGFVPGVRPGKNTAEYIQTVINRLSWVGAAFYAIIAVIPIVMQVLLGLSLGFGGTTILIVSGVALDIMKQMESRLLMRHYKGFLN